MEEPVVEVIEAATDLTPVLDALDIVNQNLQQLSAYQMLANQLTAILCGMLLGVVVVMMIYDLWRQH